MSPGAERRAALALLTAFALLVQAIIPTFAMAAPAPWGGMTICAEGGQEAVPFAPDPASPAGSHDCQHCVCPAPALAASPLLSTSAAAYAAEAETAAPLVRGVRAFARAPPRPPGQGPPLSDA